MKVYKDRQFIVFDFENGSTCKYDLQQKKMIGKKGAPVKSLNAQLSNISASELINSFENENYRNFLWFVKNCVETNAGHTLKNVGTILKHVNKYAKFEQIFSAGISRVRADFHYTVNDVPAGLLKILRNHPEIALSNVFLEFYKQNPDAFNTAFSLEYNALTYMEVFGFVTRGLANYATNWQQICVFTNLINNYGYNATALMLYVDRLKTFEAIDNMLSLATELLDYARMMSQIGAHFDKYPKHWLTTHNIAVRNYNRLKQTFDEKAFAKRVDPEMEWSYKGYVFLYPKTTQDIKDEAVAQNNCVASYIKRVIDGDCHIMFLRDRLRPDESLVTLEVVRGKIVQAKRHYNYDITAGQTEAIEAWNRWYAKKVAA